jgi:hypothetical protein
MTLRDLRSVSLALVVVGFLATACRAGYGRQTMVVEADYDEAAVCHWIEHNADAIQKSTGAKILDTHGDLVTLEIDTKYGTETFRIRRTVRHGDYVGTFVDRSTGTLSDYAFRMKVTSLEGGRSQIEITMTATSENNNGVAVNIELRKSLRLMRSFLEHYLTRE